MGSDCRIRDTCFYGQVERLRYTRNDTPSQKHLQIEVEAIDGAFWKRVVRTTCLGDRFSCKAIRSQEDSLTGPPTIDTAHWTHTSLLQISLSANSSVPPSLLLSNLLQTPIHHPINLRVHPLRHPSFVHHVVSLCGYGIISRLSKLRSTVGGEHRDDKGLPFFIYASSLFCSMLSIIPPSLLLVASPCMSVLEEDEKLSIMDSPSFMVLSMV